MTRPVLSWSRRAERQERFQARKELVLPSAPELLAAARDPWPPDRPEALVRTLRRLEGWNGAIDTLRWGVARRLHQYAEVHRLDEEAAAAAQLSLSRTVVDETAVR